MMTPEEKLLQAIEHPATEPPRTFARLASTLLPRAVLMTWLGKLKVMRTGPQPMLTLRLVNRGLVVLCGLLTIVWVADFLSVRSEFQRRLETLERTQLTAPGEPKTKTAPTIEFADILASAKQRSIFTFLPPKPDALPPAVAAELTTAVKDLKLVGILWSDNPQAMIEQAKGGKTLLLGTGEVIGSLRIKKIAKDKVVLGQDNGTQEWELR